MDQSQSPVRTFKDFNSFIDEFLEPRAAALAMTAEPCGLDELTSDWQQSPQRIHSAKGFFDIGGVNITRAAGREVSGWRQPMIFEGGEGGLIALVSNLTHPPHEDVWRYLIRAKAEPGNYGYCIDGVNTRVLVSAPLQFSMANLKNHRGKVPLAELAIDDAGELRQEIVFELAPEDGSRFYEKCNRYGLIDCRNPDEVDASIGRLGAGGQDFAWVERNLLRYLRRRGLLNAHLRSAMSLIV